MNHRLASYDVVVGGIDICARRAQIGIERQRLIEFVCYMQINVLRNAAVVSIEVLVVPLITAVVTARTVRPAVVTTHGNHILSFFHIGSQVESECHHTVFTEAQVMPVQIDIRPLTYPLELDEYLTLHLFLRQQELLSIPTNGIRQINDILAERLITIEGIRQCLLLPTTIIERSFYCLRIIANAQSPVGIEIKFLSLDGICRQGDEQSKKSNDYLMCVFSHNI